MKKLALALAIAAITTTASAQTTTTTTTSSTTTTTYDANGQPLPHKHWHHKHPVAQPVVATPVNVQYRQIHIGDPTVIYHEIGTSGAQRNNTIVPFWNEPIQSVKPYEIRYDYSI